MRRRFSYGSELSAGAAFVLAGFSSGTGVCARGGMAARRNSECGIGARDERIRLSGSVAEFCRWFMSAFAVLLRRFPRRMLVLAVLPRHLSSVYPCLCGAVEALSSARVWLCGSVGAFCLRFTPAFEVLLRCLSSVHACCLPHGDKQDGLRYVAFLFRRSRSPFVRSRGVGAVICLGGNAELVCAVMRFLSPRLASVYARRCGSVRAVCARSGTGLAVLLRCLSSVHACCLPHGDKQDGLRYLAFLFRRVEIAFARSRGVGAVICLGGFTSGLAVYLWRSRRVTGDAGTGLAARRLCVFAQSHWL